MTFPLSLINNYDGSGYALAAISDNRVVALAYIRDIDESLNTAELFIDELSPAEASAAVAGSEKCAKTALFLEEKGFSKVAFGLVSAGELNTL